MSGDDLCDAVGLCKVAKTFKSSESKLMLCMVANEESRLLGVVLFLDQGVVLFAQCLVLVQQFLHHRGEQSAQ